MFAIVNTQTKSIVAFTTDPNYPLESGEKAYTAPDNTTFENCKYLILSGKKVVFDETAILNDIKSAKIAEIKTQAKNLITDTDWQLQRATERESCGFVALGELDAVLTARENIRQSSNLAEEAVLALTTKEDVENFTWEVQNVVESPHRITKRQFLDRFTDNEIAAILAACEQNAVLNVFYEKVKLATYISLNEESVQLGLQMLELGGLLSPGRAAEILAVETAENTESTAENTESKA